MNNQPAQAPVKGTPKKKNKAVTIIVNVVLILAILFAAMCAFTAFMNETGNETPSIFGLKIFSIQSGSMDPTIKEGDLVIDVAVKDATKLEKDDVITFYTTIGGETVLNTHRIIEVHNNGSTIHFTTKGDANTYEDTYDVYPNKIQGKYTGIRLPKIGSFIDFLQTKNGFLFVIVLPVAVFFIWQLVLFFRSLFAYQAEKVRLQYMAMGAAPQPPVGPQTEEKEDSQAPDDK